MGQTFLLPLIPVFLAYVLGLYLGHFDLPFYSRKLLLILPGLWVIWGSFIAVKKVRWGSWTCLVFFSLLGIFSIQTYLHPNLPPFHISRFAGVDGIAVEGTIQGAPYRSPEGVRLLIRARKVVVADHHIPVSGDVLFLLPGEEGPLYRGDPLRLACKLYRPHGFRNPGGFSYERTLAFERVHALGVTSGEPGWVKLGEGFQNPVLLRLERGRDHIRDFLNRETSFPSSSILKALVLGEQKDVPQDISEQFVHTGIAHLLAISGDHLGIIALLSFSLFLWILKRSEWALLSVSVKKWTAGITIPCILLYTFIAGAGISVIRATLMVIVFFLSILFNRERNLLHTLALTAFLILLVSPPSLFDVSFQLSFFAVLSILYLVPRFLPAIRRRELTFPEETSLARTLGRYIKVSLLVTAVAILGTAPFVALHFNRISPLGFVTNLFFVPWVGFLIVPLAIIASVLSFFIVFLAAPLIHLAGWMSAILLKTVAFFGSIPLASVFISTPTFLEIALFYGLLFAAAHLRNGKKARYLFAALCFIFVLDGVYWSLKDRFQKNVTLTFIDVGQGDSILIEFPKGRKMLIDGGGLRDDRFDMGKNVIAPFLWSKKIRHLDYLVLTHPDPDHMNGLNFMASHFSIGQFWDSGLRADSGPYQRLEKTLLEKGIKRFSLNEEVSLEEINGVRISVLNPSSSLTERIPLKGDRARSLINNHSLVLKLQFGNTRILLTGDIEKEAEDRILRRGHPVAADLIKIPHHGSLSSSTRLFLESVNPSWAVLSVAERNIGRLPHPEVVKRYEGLGIKVFRTDYHGAVTVTTDGHDIEVRPFIKRDSVFWG